MVFVVPSSKYRLDPYAFMLRLCYQLFTSLNSGILDNHMAFLSSALLNDEVANSYIYEGHLLINHPACSIIQTHYCGTICLSLLHFFILQLSC